MVTGGYGLSLPPPQPPPPPLEPSSEPEPEPELEPELKPGPPQLPPPLPPPVHDEPVLVDVALLQERAAELAARVAGQEKVEQQEERQQPLTSWERAPPLAVPTAPPSSLSAINTLPVAPLIDSVSTLNFGVIENAATTLADSVARQERHVRIQRNLPLLAIFGSFPTGCDVHKYPGSLAFFLSRLRHDYRPLCCRPSPRRRPPGKRDSKEKLLVPLSSLFFSTLGFSFWPLLLATFWTSLFCVKF